jgi:hypothetical protein
MQEMVFAGFKFQKFLGGMPSNPRSKGVARLSKVRGSWFLEATDFCHPQARQIHRCIFAPVTSVNAHYYSVLTTPFDMVNAHYVIIDFRTKFFIKRHKSLASVFLKRSLLATRGP